MNDLTGQHLGARFEVTARADDLGLGPAWTARDAEFGDLCVVRALRPDRDLRPLEPYRRLQGTRVLSLRAVGVEHDSAWAASDAPEGQPLARLLDAARREGRPIDLAEARALGLALSSALFTAHQLGDDRIAAHGALTPWCVRRCGSSRRATATSRWATSGCSRTCSSRARRTKRRACGCLSPPSSPGPSGARRPQRTCSPPR